ncbi:hypothetical protein MAR_016149 [Mya arenaria]|uniref:Vesicular, overexpressed in cancer, prosurvival protein 1 n=1 Tax=Mya arenaria TaxID=6604 RepID=A0ABY7FIZ4_MYAAR|nr:hypothetical protein MAR_016149 [Mya arenaria]
MAVLKHVFLLILSTVGLVRSYDYCGEILSCAEGYCCEDNTRCCDSLGTGGFVGLGFGIFVFVCFIAAVAYFCRRRYYTRQPVYIQHPLPGANVTVVNTSTGAPVPQGIHQGYMHQPPTGQAEYMHQLPTAQAGFVNPMADQTSYSPPFSK